MFTYFLELEYAEIGSMSQLVYLPLLFFFHLLLICKSNWVPFITMGWRKPLTMKSEQMMNVMIKVLLSQLNKPTTLLSWVIWSCWFSTQHVFLTTLEAHQRFLTLWFTLLAKLLSLLGFYDHNLISVYCPITPVHPQDPLRKWCTHSIARYGVKCSLNSEGINPML